MLHIKPLIVAVSANVNNEIIAQAMACGFDKVVEVLKPVRHLSYSQYPIKRFYKGDSVIIMSVEQGEEINKLYSKYNDTISLLKENLKIKNIKYDSIFNTISAQKDSFYNWKYKYSLNKSLYQDWEENQKKIDKLHAWSKILLIFIIVFQFNQLQ